MSDPPKQPSPPDRVLTSVKKATYREELNQVGYFCQICGQEQQNPAGLVHFLSSEASQALNVCHDCLPEWFE